MKTKIFNGNQYVGKFNCTGKRETFGMKVKRWFRNGVKLITVILIIGASGYVYRVYSAPIETVTKQVSIDVSDVILSEKINKMKMDVVNQIRDCERDGHKEDDGLIVFDSNAVASLGTLQYQQKTPIYYYKTLYGKTITGKEAVLIAYDDVRAKELARDILFKAKDGWKNWYNCSMEKNIPSQIDAIKKLEK